MSTCHITLLISLYHTENYFHRLLITSYVMLSKFLSTDWRLWKVHRFTFKTTTLIVRWNRMHHKSTRILITIIIKIMFLNHDLYWRTDLFGKQEPLFESCFILLLSTAMRRYDKNRTRRSMQYPLTNTANQQMVHSTMPMRTNNNQINV